MLSVSRATIAIPARIGSRRISCKPLAEISGKPLVVHVVEQALRVECAHEVVVITDSHDVADAVGGRCDVLIEDRPAWCGTHRIAMAWDRAPSLFPTRQEPRNIVINWQIDEPFVRPDDVAGMVTLVEFNPDPRRIVTLVSPLSDPVKAFDANVVLARVSRMRMENPQSMRLWEATRFCRSGGGGSYRRHLGVYGFSATALAAMGKIERSSRSKRTDLEQVAWLEAGYRIVVKEVAEPPLSVHTADDVQVANEMLWRPKHAKIDARRVTV